MRLVYTRFFFFKQKTAYEMRISDWSSDVCSSDLIFMKIDDPNKTWDLANKTIGKQHVATFDNYEPGMGSSYKRRRELRVQEMEIGRASCRERVGQYV